MLQILYDDDSDNGAKKPLMTSKTHKLKFFFNFPHILALVHVVISLHRKFNK